MRGFFFAMSLQLRTRSPIGPRLGHQQMNVGVVVELHHELELALERLLVRVLAVVREPDLGAGRGRGQIGLALRHREHAAARRIRLERNRRARDRRRGTMASRPSTIVRG